MKITEIFSFRYDFCKHEKDTCVKSSGMNAMFDISYKCEVFNSYDNYYERKNRVHLYSLLWVNSCASICFHYMLRFLSLRNKMVNLVLVIKYHFNFRLQFDINKKMHFLRFYRNLGKRMSSINVRSG